MIDALGRIVCQHCNSTMRLITLIPNINNTTTATFKCWKCDHIRELNYSKVKEKVE